MATQFGQFGQFDQEKDKFTEYEERKEFFFLTKNVAEGGKKAIILLSSNGQKQFRLVKDQVHKCHLLNSQKRATLIL